MISIIFPSYNSSPWIAAAIESVIAQTMTDWELIAVDDGSDDDTIEIISRFVDTDPRIRIIRASHGGQSHARNIGIDNASGEYVTFLDSDDLLPAEALSILLDGIGKTGADMAAASLMKFKDGKEEKAIAQYEIALRDHTPVRWSEITGMEAVKESLYQTGMNSSMGGKLYRRFLFDEIRFKDGEIYEDLNIFYRLGLKARKVAVTELPLYFYRQRKGSTVHTFNSSRLDVIKVTDRMRSYVTVNAPALIDAVRDRRYSANFNMVLEISRHLRNVKLSKDDTLFYQIEREESMQYLRLYAVAELKDRNVRIKNKLGALSILLLPNFIVYKICSIL